MLVVQTIWQSGCAGHHGLVTRRLEMALLTITHDDLACNTAAGELAHAPMIAVIQDGGGDRAAASATMGKEFIGGMSWSKFKVIIARDGGRWEVFGQALPWRVYQRYHRVVSYSASTTISSTSDAPAARTPVIGEASER